MARQRGHPGHLPGCGYGSCRGRGRPTGAYLDFISAYNDLRDNPPACDATLTGTLAGEVLLPGVYCVDDVAKTGTLTLDAGTSGANAVWLFLVDGVADRALTGTNFNVVMINGGEPVQRVLVGRGPPPL